MKLRRILYSALALSILGTTGVDSLNGNEVTVQAKSSHKVKLLKYYTYKKKTLVYGTSGVIYKNYKLQHPKDNLSNYKHEPFLAKNVAKIKLKNGKITYAVLIVGNGVYGYVKLNKLFIYKNNKNSQSNDNQNQSGSSSTNNTGSDNSQTGSNGQSGANNNVTSTAQNGQMNSNNGTQTNTGTSTQTNSGNGTSTNTGTSTQTNNGNGTQTNTGTSTQTNSGNGTSTNTGTSTQTNSGKNTQSNTNNNTQTNSSGNTNSNVTPKDNQNANSKNGITSNTIANGIPNSAAIMTALNQINSERQQRGVAPYTLNSKLMAVANQRAQQLATNFSHYDSNGNAIYEGLIDQSGLDVGYKAENIGMVDDQSKTISEDFLSDIHDMMYNDADSNWGHRYNFLNNKNTLIGIGVYQASDGSVYMAYDMGGF